MKTRHETLSIVDETDIAMARIAGRDLARGLGFDTVDVHCIVISISELATNIFAFAGRGVIELRQIESEDRGIGLEVVASDSGPGIYDLELAMTDGQSTNGGLGGGLPGVKRLMSEMEITSVVGQGTVVKAVKWLIEAEPTRGLGGPLRRLVPVGG